jgi:hypothetical protein
MYRPYEIRTIAVVLVAVGNVTVKLLLLETLSAPKSNTITAALVSVVFAVPLAEGVVL